MSKTLSNMLALGTDAPEFALKDVLSEQLISLKQSKHKATLVMFICNHCPYVKHVLSGIVELANDYMPKDVRVIAINSNDVEQYPDDSPEAMQQVAKAFNFPFPYLFDETQEVATAYQAACTPDFYLFDEKLSLVYRGQMDDSRPGNGLPVTGKAIRDALDSVLNGAVVTEEQRPSLGCNIKWKK